MRADWPDVSAATVVLRVDGGMTASDWTMQRLADLLNAPVDRPMIQETTALGAAYLAGLSTGVYGDVAQLSKLWRVERRFMPTMGRAQAGEAMARWERAVRMATAR
jgi:glycerol kinase